MKAACKEDIDMLSSRYAQLSESNEKGMNEKDASSYHRIGGGSTITCG